MRVVVVGGPGSGKTTLARSLAPTLEAPHLELDGLWWHAGWQAAVIRLRRRACSTATFGRDRLRVAVGAVVAGDAWVVDGFYVDEIADLLWARADLIVWLDVPRWQGVGRAVRRSARRALGREPLWNGNRESLAVLTPWSVARLCRRWPTYPARIAAELGSGAYAHVTIRRVAGSRLAAVSLRPDVDIDGCARAHRRLEEAVADLGDDDVRGASLLPDWTIAHVLTHLARNADSHVRMAEGAARGEVVTQYAPDQREREIEEGATRSAHELVEDVRRTNRAAEAAWHALSDDVWTSGRSRVRQGEVPIRLQPLRRWREVEFHLADLGLGAGFTYADFDPVYVAREESDASPPRYGGRTDRDR